MGGQITLPTNIACKCALLYQKWWKSKGGMFEIFFPLFKKKLKKFKKFWTDLAKYTPKCSSGPELQRGISVFIPGRWENMKKLLRREGKNREVLECMPSSSHQLYYWSAMLNHSTSIISSSLTSSVSLFITLQSLQLSPLYSAPINLSAIISSLYTYCLISNHLITLDLSFLQQSLCHFTFVLLVTYLLVTLHPSLV